MDAAKSTISGPLKRKAVLIEQKTLRYRYKSPVSKDDYKKAAMPDAYINYKSSKESIDKFNNSPLRKIEKGLVFLGLPAALSLIDGALSGAETVSKKIGKSFESAKTLGVAAVGLLGGFKAADVATRKTPGLKKFRENHPFLTDVGIMGSGLAGAIIANPIVGKISSLAAKIPAKGESLGSKLSGYAKNLGGKLDNSAKVGEFLDKNIFGKTKEFVEKPAAQFVGKHWLAFLAGGVALKYLADVAIIRHNKNKAKRQLENERKESQKKIVMNPFAGRKSLIRIEETNKILIIPAETKKAFAD